MKSYKKHTLAEESVNNPLPPTRERSRSVSVLMYRLRETAMLTICATVDGLFSDGIGRGISSLQAGTKKVEHHNKLQFLSPA